MTRALVYLVAWCSTVCALRRWPLPSHDCSPCKCSYIPQTRPAHPRQGKVADCSGQGFTRVPHHMPQDTTFLDMSHNHIQALLDNEVNGYYYLKGISLGHNNLTTISRVAFTTAPYLKFIDLTGNHLRLAPPDGFDDLPSLLEIRGLNLDDPSNDLFIGIRQLHILELRTSSTNLREDIFSGMKLRHLQLHLDKAKQLPKTLLQSLSSTLNKLEIKGDEITSLDKEFLLNLLVLQTVKLETKSLATLPHEFFHREPLSQDNHDVLPQSFYTIKEISIIGIAQLSGDTLNNFPNLETLTIQQADIISGELFQSMLRVNSMNIAHNRISQIENTWFDDLKSLKILNLSHNSLTTLQTSEFSKMYSIQSLDVSHNSIHTVESDCFASFHNSLANLDLSSNKICSLPTGVFSSMYQLQELNLENNCLGKFTSELFQEEDAYLNGDMSVQNLMHLNISNNNITILPNELFQSALMLTTLDMSYNQLTSLPREMIMYNELITFVNLEGNPLNCDCGLIYFLFLDLKEKLIGFCKTPASLANKALRLVTEVEVCPELFTDPPTTMPTNPPTRTPKMVERHSTTTAEFEVDVGDGDDTSLPDQFFTILFDAKLDGDRVAGNITGKINNTRFTGYLTGTKSGLDIWGNFHGDANSSTKFVGNYYCGSVADGKLSGTFVGFFNKTGVSGIIGGLVANETISGQFVEFGVSNADMGDVLGSMDDDDLGGTMTAVIDGPFITGHYTGSVDDIKLAGSLIGTRDGHILDGIIMSSTNETILPMDATFVGTVMDLNVSGIFVGSIGGYPVNGCVLGIINDTTLTFPMKAILGKDQTEQGTEPGLSTGGNTGTIQGFINDTVILGSFLGSIEGKPVHGTISAKNNDGELRGKLISPDGATVPLDAIFLGKMIDSNLIASFVGVLDGESVKGHIKVDTSGSVVDGGFGGIYSETDFSKYVTHAQFDSGVLHGLLNMTARQAELLPVIENVLLEWNSKVDEEEKGHWIANLDSKGLKVNFTGTLENGRLETSFAGLVNGTEVSGNLSAISNGTTMSGTFTAVVGGSIINGFVSKDGVTFVVTFTDEETNGRQNYTTEPKDEYQESEQGPVTEPDESRFLNKTGIPFEVQLVLEDVLLQWINKASNATQGVWETSLNNTDLKGNFSGTIKEGAFQATFTGVVNGKAVEVTLTVPVKGSVLNGTFLASVEEQSFIGTVSKGRNGTVITLDTTIEGGEKPDSGATTDKSMSHFIRAPSELQLVIDDVLLQWINEINGKKEGEWEKYLNDSEIIGRFNAAISGNDIHSGFKGMVNGTEVTVVLNIPTKDPFLNESVNGTFIASVGGMVLSGIVSSDGTFFIAWLENTDSTGRGHATTNSVGGGENSTSAAGESDEGNGAAKTKPDRGDGEQGIRPGYRPNGKSSRQTERVNTSKWWVPVIAIALFAGVVASIVGIIKARGWLYKRNYTVNRE